MTDLPALCIAVYDESVEWSYGRSTVAVCAAEGRLREALDAQPHAWIGHPVVEAARRVHALGGFHFDRPCDLESQGVGEAEAAWGEAVRNRCPRCGGQGQYEADTCRCCGGTGTKRPPARTLKAGDG